MLDYSQIETRLRKAQDTQDSVLVRFRSAKSGKVLTWRCQIVEVCAGTTRSLGGLKSGKLGDNFVRVITHLGHRSIDFSTISEVC